MAVRYEYWTAAFAVGLEGLNDWDQAELNAIAAEGWEPYLMTSVHGGFATLVMFRREAAAKRPPATATAKAAKKAAPAAAKKAAPAKKAAAASKR